MANKMKTNIFVLKRFMVDWLWRLINVVKCAWNSGCGVLKVVFWKKTFGLLFGHVIKVFNWQYHMNFSMGIPIS